MKTSSFLILFILACTGEAFAQNALDTTFGTGGKVQVYPATSDMAVQTDEKIVTINNSGVIDFGFHLFRYKSNGSPDSSFGVNGAVYTKNPYRYYTIGHGIAIQPDGKIIAVGYTIKYNAGNDYLFLRYLPDGSIDSSFGTNGYAIIGNKTGEALYKVALQPDGKIVACGNEDFGNVKVLRLYSNGTPDSAFGTNGIATLTLAAFNTSNSLAIQTDGKILVGGIQAPSNGSSGVFVTRFLSNGSLDSSFGSRGFVSLGKGRYAVGTYFKAMRLLNNGNILLGLQMSDVGGNEPNKIDIVRLKPDGSFDSSFATNGQLILQSEQHKDPYLQTLIVQNDNKIVIAATYRLQKAQIVYRFMPGGAVDATFGNNGRAIAAFDDVTSYEYTTTTAANQSNEYVLFGGYIITRYYTGITAPIIAKKR